MTELVLLGGTLRLLNNINVTTSVAAAIYWALPGLGSLDIQQGFLPPWAAQASAELKKNLQNKRRPCPRRSHSPLQENLTVIWSGAWVSVVFEKPFYFDMLLNLQKNCKTNTNYAHRLFTQNRLHLPLYTLTLFLFFLNHLEISCKHHACSPPKLQLFLRTFSSYISIVL